MRYAPLVCAALLVLTACGDSTGPSGNEELCTASEATGTIAIGETRSSSITAADCILPNDSRGDGWQLTIAENTVLQVDLISADFDAVVVITDAAFNVVAADDDSGASTNTALIASLPPGTYMVWATSFEGGLGDYDLSVGPALTPACVVAAPTGSIAAGETIQGELDASDCLLANGTVAERWQLTVTEAQSLRIDMRSTVFDTYLYVSNDAGAFIAADDDTGDGVNSRIQLTLDPGTYLLWASSFEVSSGAFDLSVAATGTVAGPEGSAAGPDFDALRAKPARGAAPWKVSPR